jgi:hypothetical protein
MRPLVTIWSWDEARLTVGGAAMMANASSIARTSDAALLIFLVKINLLLTLQNPS